MNKENIVLGARAETDGVVIYFNNLHNNDIGFKTSVDAETGEFFSTRITDNYTEGAEIYATNINISAIKLILTFVFLVILGILAVQAGILWLPFAFCYFITFVWLNINWAIKIFLNANLFKKPQVISQAKYHAAVHKVLNAYKEFGRIPTLEEVKNASMYSPYCDSLYFLSKSLLYIIINICFVLDSINLFGTTMLIIIGPLFFFFMMRKFTLFCKIQKIILIEPDEKNLECAIEALKLCDSYIDWQETLTDRSD